MPLLCGRDDGSGLILHRDGLVLRYQGLHDAPADEVGDGADAEHYHVGSGFAIEAEERKVSTLIGSPVKEHTRAEVDAHRA